MPKKDLVSWNTMLQVLGAHGYGKEALVLLLRIIREGIQPDKVMFIAVLCLSNHASLIDESIYYLYSIEKVYGLVI